MDDPDSLRQTLVRKHIKYHNLLGKLQATLPNYSVEQFTFVIGRIKRKEAVFLLSLDSLDSLNKHDIISTAQALKSDVGVNDVLSIHTVRSQICN